MLQVILDLQSPEGILLQYNAITVIIIDESRIIIKIRAVLCPDFSSGYKAFVDTT